MEQPEVATSTSSLQTLSAPQKRPRKGWLIFAAFAVLALCIFAFFARGAKRRVPADAVIIKVGSPIAAPSYGKQSFLCPISFSNSTPRFLSVCMLGVQFKDGNSWSNSDILAPIGHIPVPPTSALRNSVVFSAKPPPGPWRFHVILSENLHGTERLNSELRDFVGDVVRATKDKTAVYPSTPFVVGMVLGHSNECFIEAHELARP